MTQEMMKTAMIVCTGVTFTTALIAGVAAWAAANAWLTNRREARAAQEERSEKRKEQERATWAAMVADRDEQIASLKDQLSRMQTLSEIADRLLVESETRRVGNKTNDALVGKLMRAWDDRDKAKADCEKVGRALDAKENELNDARIRACKAEELLRKAEARA